MRIEPETPACTCTGPGPLHRHDSANPCCKAARQQVNAILRANHYLHCNPGGTVHTWSWRVDGEILAVMTIGTGSAPGAARGLSNGTGVRALELTRLWASPRYPEGELTRFVAKAFKSIKYALFVYSYADADQLNAQGYGHTGGIYRSIGGSPGQTGGFNYAGWSDMTRPQKLRKSPTRKGGVPFSEWNIISAKHRYWILVGVKGAERKRLLAAAGWPCYDWRKLSYAPPVRHRRIDKEKLEQVRVSPR